MTHIFTCMSFINFQTFKNFINIYFPATDSSMLCSANLTVQSCESSDLERNKVCQSPNVKLWLTLINEDHKDGPQHIRAPFSTNIQEFCSSGKNKNSQDYLGKNS